MTICTYGGPGKVWATDYFQRDCDMMSYAQTLTVNDIYVWCVERKDKADFYEQTVLVSNRETMKDEIDYENFFWIYKKNPDDGSPMESVEYADNSSSGISGKLSNRESAQIKWFSLEQVEEARAYFGQFTGQQETIVLQDTADRSAAYENTVLKYMPYIEGGAFSIDGNRYLFSSLTEEESFVFFRHDMNAVVEFDGGSASSATRYIDIIDEGNGNYIALKRGHLVRIKEVGTEFEIEVYELSEEEAVEAYNNYRGESIVSSIAEIVQKERN